MTRMLRASILLLATLATVLCAAAAGAADGDARSHAVLAYQRDLVASLSSGGDGQALLGAALLARSIPAERPQLSFHALIERAAGAAPDAPAVSWLRLGDCSAAALDCPNAQALQRLQQLAPDNAAVWLVVLGTAVHRADSDGARHAMLMASRARRYDDYAGRSLQALAAAISQVAPPTVLEDAGLSPRGTGALLVFALGRAQPRPALPATAQWCRDHRKDAPWRQRCLRLAAVLVRAGSPLARSLGLYLQQTLAGDPQVRQHAAAARRVLVWQVQQFDRLAAQADRDDVVADMLLALAREGEPELTVMQRALQHMGIALQPPAEWAPTGERDHG